MSIVIYVVKNKQIFKLKKIDFTTYFRELIIEKKMEEKNVCAICYDDLPDSASSESGRSFKLNCSHEFHTTCIIEWFRRGNKTCPYCKDTGNIDNDTTNNVFDLNENNDTNSWERHIDVQNFLRNFNLSKPIVIRAYVKRDEGMGINPEDTYNLIIRKLGLSNEIIRDKIKNKYKKFIQDNLDNDIDYHISRNTYTKYFDIQWNSSKNNEKRLKFHNLEKCYNSQNFNLYDLYNHLSLDELMFMGW